ncbi:hypothetical protein MIND_00432200 [Mycena indigotica]|uniref:Uncharacterized protein n=1 Tax=Mycena indigotica TaxID=2126181 RepID=A0A8H6SUH4_9AGAR|nr:uncharacterized protein MIND_00432200 [Mycena indigotica]KAF7306410.1 hypothetical protein MIND_00432200 [Mycena indigotica]
MMSSLGWEWEHWQELDVTFQLNEKLLGNAMAFSSLHRKQHRSRTFIDAHLPLLMKSALADECQSSFIVVSNSDFAFPMFATRALVQLHPPTLI